MAGRAFILLLISTALCGLALAEVSIMNEDDTCDMCVLVANAMDKSFLKHTSSSVLETGVTYNADGSMSRRKRIKYNKSETRLLEVLESVCPQMDEYRTNYWDPFQPKFVRRDKDIKNPDGKTQQEFVQTQNLQGNSPAELLLAFKKQMVDQFGDRIDDAQELRGMCGRLLEEFEEDIEDWYSSSQETEIKELLCIQSMVRHFNYSCCIPEYSFTLDACENRDRRKAELEKKVKEPQVVPPVEDAPLPPGQMRDEKGVIWQLDPDGKNPFEDWQPPSLGPNQIMDEQGVIWQVEKDSDAMRAYQIRMAKKKREMEKKAKEWEALRHPKEQEDTQNNDTIKVVMSEAEKNSRPSRELDDTHLAMRAARKLAEEDEENASVRGKTSDKSRKVKDASTVTTATSTTSPAAATIPTLHDPESADGVFTFFSEHGIAEHARTLIEKGYDTLTVIAEMTKEDLIEAGIELPGHRKKILMAISRLKPREDL